MSHTGSGTPPAAIRLHLNESTGCSPAVLEALQATTAADIAHYADPGPAAATAARWLGVPDEWVLLTNGLDEGLRLVAQAGLLRALESGAPQAVADAHVLFPEPAFDMYAASAEASGLAVVRIAPEPDLGFPLDDLLAAIGPGTRVVNLTDPNNPTGLPLPAGAIECVLEAAPGALVLVDEAYADFSGRTAIGPLLERHRHMVVGRTFAKGHGLAGLRIGALVAHPDTLRAFARIQPPFSLNVCAVRALAAALSDRAHLERSVAQSADARRLIYQRCDRLGLHYWVSEANFVLVRVGDDTPAVVSGLEDRGILVRDRSHLPGCAGCVRITAASADDTRRCLDALEDLLATRAH